MGKNVFWIEQMEKNFIFKDLVKEKQDKTIVFVVSKDGIIAKSGEIDLKGK